MAIVQPIPNNPQFKNLTGQVFGRLTVVSFAGIQKGNSRWNCLCECGNESAVSLANLTTKKAPTRSCGCLHREVCSASAKVQMTTHGLTETPEFAVWCNMLDRCYNTKAKAFWRYGGRGITVCDRWRTSFEAFLADMGQRPSEGHSIDRCDNEKGYCPENCRWATWTEQNRNRSSARLITHEGQTHPLIRWSELTGLSDQTIRYRLSHGWSVHDALTNPKCR